MPSQADIAYELPPGWMIRRQGDEISVCAPDAKPGMKFVSANSKSLEDRLLYALAEALLSKAKPQPEPMTEDGKRILFECVPRNPNWGDREWFLEGVERAERAERAHGIVVAA